MLVQGAAFILGTSTTTNLLWDSSATSTKNVIHQKCDGKKMEEANQIFMNISVPNIEHFRPIIFTTELNCSKYTRMESVCGRFFFEFYPFAAIHIQNWTELFVWKWKAHFQNRFLFKFIYFHCGVLKSSLLNHPAIPKCLNYTQPCQSVLTVIASLIDTSHGGEKGTNSCLISASWVSTAI